MSAVELPHLSRVDIEGALREAYARARQHHVFAFHGTGEPDAFDLPEAGRFQIVPVRSELELREKLPLPTEEASRLVFLVPWTEDIPVDIAGRFALNGRVRRIGRDVQLLRLFGVPEADPELARGVLASYLLRPGHPGRYVISESRLTADTMWATWLRTDFGVPTEGGLALDTLLGWAAVDSHAHRFKEAMAHPKAEGLREALLAHLRRVLGPAGPVVWSSWEAGTGGALAEWAVVLEALAAQPSDQVRFGMRTIARRDLGGVKEEDLEVVIEALASAAALALRYVERVAGEGASRAIVRAADLRLDDPVLVQAAGGSTRLPSAWAARLDRLGAAIEAAAAGPNRETVQAARACLSALETHISFKDAEETRRVARAEMAVRLLAWLAARPDQKLEPGPQPYGELEALGRWYAEEGGYVDRARRAARGATDTPFDRGIAAVVAAADRARTELDRRFARALAAWVEAGRPSNRVLPIDEVARRVIARFLEEQPERKLLVLLLDGMAWAQAVEILESLGERALPWGPLAWHTSKKGQIGDSAYPVMLANLPSITEVSRSSFFAGLPVPPGRDHDPQKDPERWRDNAEIKRFFGDLDHPPLFLRSESHTRAGAASQEALTLVGDGSRRVVAIVVNAIDDALKSNPAVRHPWGVDNIASLPDLLEKARESERAVLLVGDHGHVPADRMEYKGMPKGGARWRPWLGPSDVVAEYEVALRAAPGVWAPRGAEGVVLLADDASRYGSSTHAGEHGGATLAEVVTPCVLIGCEGLRPTDQPDPGLALRAAHVPSWWYFDVAPVASAPPLEAPPTRKSSVKGQRPSPPPAGAVSRGGSAAKVESAFARSGVLAKVAPSREVAAQVIRAVDFLLAKNGVATVAQFAAELEELPRRAGGLVAKLSEVLNLDGYPVLSLDAAAGQVRLDIGKLRMLFEVRE